MDTSHIPLDIFPFMCYSKYMKIKALVNPADIVYKYIVVEIPASATVDYVKLQKAEMIKKAEAVYPKDITVIKWPLEFSFKKEPWLIGYVAQVGIKWVDASKLKDIPEEDIDE